LKQLIYPIALFVVAIGSIISCTTPAIATGVSISGQVRHDLNSNGDLTESDPGISGVTLKLYQDDGNGSPTGLAIATTTTDSSGNYSFSNLVPGNYVIVETNPINFASSGDSQGANDDKILVSLGSFDNPSNIFLDVDTTRLDYGDAPDTFGTKFNGATTATTGGARHQRDGKLYLGSGVTGESDGQPSTTATLDNSDDGVTLSPALGPNYSTLIQAGISNTVDVVASGTGYLNAWVDYNENGVFDAGEQIFTNQPVIAGKNTLTFPTAPPNTLLHGPTYVRFRLSPSSIPSPSPQGLVIGGEVEDYQVNVADPIPNPTLCTTTGLLNGDFEQPSGVSTFIQTPETNVPGWNTNASDNLIEIWKSGFNGVSSFSGNQFAEVNATKAATLFQDIATVPGATMTWRIAHRARVGIDTLDIKAGPPGSTTPLRRVSSDTSGWVVYQGTYIVSANQYITRFEFDAVSTGSGNVSVGNFLDGVQFSTNSCVTPIAPPTIDLDGNDSSYAIGYDYRNIFSGSSILVSAADTDVTIGDDKTTITKANIVLTTRPDTTNESLSIDVTAGGTVSGVTASSYNSSTGQITLTGSAVFTDYQKIISTLKYKNTKATPTTTNRTITVQVTDSDNLLSNLAISTLSLLIPPTIDLDANDSSGAIGSDYKNTFTVGGSPVSAADLDTVVMDDKANIRSATILLSNRPDGAAESLLIDLTGGGAIPAGTITGSYNSATGQLNLAGTTTLGNYAKILSTLKYSNTSGTPDLSDRTITVQVTDSDNQLSNTATTGIHFIMLLPPTIDLDGDDSSGATGNGYKNTFTVGGAPVSGADIDPVIADDKTNIGSATIALTNHPDGTAESLSIDATAGGTVTGITASSYNSTTGQLTLSGNATLVNYQKIIATLKYANTSAIPNFSPRTINVQIVDSDLLSSNTAKATISFSANPNVLLVKRITAINGDRTKNPNDNTPLNVFVNDPNPGDNAFNWPNPPSGTPPISTFLRGAIDAGKVKPRDTIEYTIYFLNAGFANARNVRICDRLTSSQTFVSGAYGTNKDIQLHKGDGVFTTWSSASVSNLTSVFDESPGSGDRAQLFPSSSSAPSTCNVQPVAPGVADRGTLMVDVTGMGNLNQPDWNFLSGSNGPGTANSYGFIRFTTKVNP
jgi:uncharacterized repeat protein (TIGR01451 family)